MTSPDRCVAPPSTSPSDGDSLAIKASNIRLASFYGLMESTSAAGMLSVPSVLDSWLSAEKGDASGFWFMSLAAELTFPQSFIWGDVAAASRTDARAAHDRPGSRPTSSCLPAEPPPGRPG
jgi:hypothetical protein